MLSLFPQLLFLGPAGVSLLRIAAGLAFLYMAYFFWTNSARMKAERLPLVGHMPLWLSACGALIYAVIGTALTLGLWTQGAAILAAIGALKGVIFGKKYATIMPLSRDAYVFLFLISLALIGLGAGAFSLSIGSYTFHSAIDLPL